MVVEVDGGNVVEGNSRPLDKQTVDTRCHRSTFLDNVFDSDATDFYQVQQSSPNFPLAKTNKQKIHLYVVPVL